MKIVSTPHAPAAIGPYSQAIDTGAYVFCSGQIPIDPATGKLCSDDFEAQTKQVLANVAAVLAAAGLTTQHVVKSTVFLKDMADFPKLNPLYEAAFAPHKPARSTVQVAKLPLDSRVEIEVIAFRG
ncbi:MAG: Rid family detoxifying hydrolase [Candidatus Didemnitutus sp.]|nr:Rid family detoxifying hydrolase [Candidatus Didemnitutus sp.]